MIVKILILIAWIILGLSNLISKEPIRKIQYGLLWAVAITMIINGILTGVI